MIKKREQGSGILLRKRLQIFFCKYKYWAKINTIFGNNST